jgi:hypothetical protein
MENHHFLIGKPSINGPFPMAMLNIYLDGEFPSPAIVPGFERGEPFNRRQIILILPAWSKLKSFKVACGHLVCWASTHNPGGRQSVAGHSEINWNGDTTTRICDHQSGWKWGEFQGFDPTVHPLHHRSQYISIILSLLVLVLVLPSTTISTTYLST